MTDPTTRAALRDLERAGIDRDRVALCAAEARLAEAEEALRALHTRHDANVAARRAAQADARAHRDASALARWADDDDARRRALAAERAELCQREKALADARSGRDAIARALAGRLARLQALRDVEPDPPDDA